MILEQKSNPEYSLMLEERRNKNKPYIITAKTGDGVAILHDETDKNRASGVFYFLLSRPNLMMELVKKEAGRSKG